MRRQNVLGETTFAVLLVHAATVQAVTFIVRPMISYRAIELGVSEQFLGLVGAAFALVPLILAVPTGRATDRFGERPVLIAGAGLVVAAAAAFILLGDTVVGLVVGSIVLGSGHLLSMVAGQAMVGNLAAPSGALDSAFGRYTVAASLGQTIGPALLVIIVGDATIPEAGPAFATAGVLAAVLLGAAILIRSPKRSDVDIVTRDARLADVVRIAGLGRALFAAAVILSAVDILIVYLPALGASAGLTAGAVGALLALRSGASMVSRLFLAPLSARLGRGPFLVYATSASAVAVLLIGLPTPFAVLVGALAVAGLGLGVGQPLTMSWLAEVAPPGLRGTALSLRLLGNRIGQVIVPSLAGLVAGGAGAAGVLVVTAVVLAAAAVATRRGPIGLAASG